ncbi:hypothetical protein [uncultured Brevundimonas sp.]|uniref:hypothetical protein n=1 Tax=uncultured Brevundimonas sp. TaxID=213418 RepID=UPI0030ED276D|tara:strand:+ start:807 stop:1733 length:927 start_codon:yes stop_codon:yes gene_type:complete
MNRLLPLTTALVLTLGLPQVAAAQNNGNGNGNRDKGDRGSERGQQDRSDRGDDRGERRAERREDGRNVRVEARREDREDRKDDRDNDRRERNTERRDDRRVVIANEDGRPVVLLRRDSNRGLINGCPPGLARKDNGCLPPGQARRMATQTRFDSLWNARNDEFTYRYEDGYLYRSNRQGSLLGYIPVLGGALSRGSPWPAQYDYQPVPTYLANYYGLNDRNDYRYADGTVYGLDSRTQAISQVVALLTGQSPTVGQPMPAGYDIYNVPNAYRGQYVDSAASQYRYNDGYVYQVDPKTRLVQAAIQLLT